MIRRKDGAIRTFLVSAEVLDVAGQLCTLSVGTDITERKQAEEVLSTFSRRLIEAQEAERSRIARELHDDINQRIALLAVNLSTVAADISSSKERAKFGISEACEYVQELGSDIQAISHRLHSSKLEILGLEGAAAGSCKQLSVQQDVNVDFHSEGIPKSLPQEISLCLFRVLQEALQNAVKHSGAKHFEVFLEGTPNEIQLSVHDSGVGLDLERAMSGHGLGLTSMKERLKLVDGQLSLDSKPGHGTTVYARVPLKATATAANG